MELNINLGAIIGCFICIGLIIFGDMIMKYIGICGIIYTGCQN